MKKIETGYQNIHQNIIDKCRIGDQKAQFQLYKLYYKSMYNTSFRIVNETMEAEDIIQESFLSAFDKISSYSGEVSFGAWLKKIVINNSLDIVKKKKINFNSIDDNIYEIKEEEEDQDFEKIKIEIEDIKEVINILPDGYRIVLSLYLIEGYDHEEIGKILGISSSTSRSQYTRAKQKLIEKIRKRL